MRSGRPGSAHSSAYSVYAPRLRADTVPHSRPAILTGHMTVDGRGAGGSQGVTLDELARLMKGVGCTEALNLDGGGSTALCVTDDAVLVNSPSDGSERRVLSFVALVAK